MPSRKCPECSKITTSNHKPDYCAFCGCSLLNEPFVNLFEITSKKEGKEENKNPQIKLF